jgi:hypothetical protein
MSNETDEATVETYSIGDGEVIFADAAAFFAATDSHAAQLRDGALFVLRRDSLKWENVESIHQRKPASVAAIRGQK